MKDEKKKIKDNSRYPKGFSEEYRSVRFYSNINGIEKEYGYDYKRDADALIGIEISLLVLSRA
ncbi:MAG: hypothetical protein ACTSSG_14790 [Candidatus Heimdallarchaeaceae archaeon]